MIKNIPMILITIPLGFALIGFNPFILTAALILAAIKLSMHLSNNDKDNKLKDFTKTLMEISMLNYILVIPFLHANMFVFLPVRTYNIPLVAAVIIQFIISINL